MSVPVVAFGQWLYITDLILQAVMNGHAVVETSAGFYYSGQLIQPKGFDGLLTVLQFQDLAQNVEFEGSSRPAYHLVSMKVPAACQRTWMIVMSDF